MGIAKSKFSEEKEPQSDLRPEPVVPMGAPGTLEPVEELPVADADGNFCTVRPAFSVFCPVDFIVPAFKAAVVPEGVVAGLPSFSVDAIACKRAAWEEALVASEAVWAGVGEVGGFVEESFAAEADSLNGFNFSAIFESAIAMALPVSAAATEEDTACAS